MNVEGAGRRRSAGRAWRRPLEIMLVATAAAVVGPCLGLVPGPFLGLGVNASGSAPRGLYRAVPEAPARGALVVVCLPPAIAAFGRARGYLGVGACTDGAQPVLKSVGGVAGDVIELAAARVTVNSVVLIARPIESADSRGRHLPRMPFASYRVGGDEIWLFGLSHDRSWDSRYFGPVPTAAVRGVVRPLLTRDERDR